MSLYMKSSLAKGMKLLLQHYGYRIREALERALWMPSTSQPPDERTLADKHGQAHAEGT